LKPRCNAIISANDANHSLIIEHFTQLTNQKFLDITAQNVQIEQHPNIASTLQNYPITSKRFKKASTHLTEMTTSDSFYEKLESAPIAAQNLIEQLVNEYEDNPYVEVHYKNSSTPEMRLRDLRQINGSSSQNIMTISWQPRLQHFKVRALADVSLCKQVISALKVVPTVKPEPLRSEFKLSTTGSLKDLILIVERSIAKRG
jgi:hypothetical protein